MRRTITTVLKKEAMNAIRHYTLKFLGKHQHKSYFHGRFYRLASSFFNRLGR